MQPIRQLPEASVILDYLKKDFLTETIDVGILEKISVLMENRFFNGNEIEQSVWELYPSISHRIGSVLHQCLQGLPPIFSNKGDPESKPSTPLRNVRVIGKNDPELLSVLARIKAKQQT